MIVMNWLDFILLGVIFISMIIGLFRGFIKESISLATWGLATWLALFHYDTVSQMFGDFAAPWVRDITSGIIIFLAVMIVGGVINYVVSRFIKLSGLSLFDRITGFVFGGIRGVVIIALVIVISPSITQEEWFKSSYLMPKFQIYADHISAMIPQEWNEAISRWLA